MINQSGDEYSTQFPQNFLLNDQFKTQSYLQPIKIYQQQQPQQVPQYQIHQFKQVNINDEIISPLSNSSSTSSSSSMSSTSSSTSSCNNLIQTDALNKKAKLKTINDNYTNKSQQKKLINLSTNTKKKTSQTANDLDEERTSQLVSELLRNIKEKTKQLESLNQHMKSTNHDSKSKDSIQSPTQSLNTSIETKFKRSRTKIKSKINKDLKEKTVKVPNGWERLLLTNSIVYKSPSGSVFNCLSEIRTYLLAIDTCKCGLECPLNIYETFNFDPMVKNTPSSTASSSNSLSELSNRLNRVQYFKYKYGILLFLRF